MLHPDLSDLIFRTFWDTGIAHNPNSSTSEDYFMGRRNMFGLQVDTTWSYRLNCNLEIGSNGKWQMGEELLGEDD